MKQWKPTLPGFSAETALVKGARYASSGSAAQRVRRGPQVVQPAFSACDACNLLPGGAAGLCRLAAGC
jgi:hypothetical protein